MNTKIATFTSKECALN